MFEIKFVLKFRKETTYTIYQVYTQMHKSIRQKINT